MLASYCSKYRAVPDYTGCTGENRTFWPEIEFQMVPRKNYINHVHCHPSVTNSTPITHCSLLLLPLLLHLCPSIKAASSSPCPSINVLSSLYTFLVLSASNSLINVNEWRLNGLKVKTEVNFSNFVLLTSHGLVLLLLSYYHFIIRIETLMRCSKLVSSSN